MYSKKYENWLTKIFFYAKYIFGRDFCIVKKQGREVTFFPENFKSVNILSKILELYIKCHKRLSRGKNFSMKPTFFPQFKVYDHGLSPLPLQNPYSKLLWHKIFTNLWLSIGTKMFYLSFVNLKILQENAFSEASFSTLGLQCQ